MSEADPSQYGVPGESPRLLIALLHYHAKMAGIIKNLPGHKYQAGPLIDWRHPAVALPPAALAFEAGGICGVHIMDVDYDRCELIVNVQVRDGTPRAFTGKVGFAACFGWFDGTGRSSFELDYDDDMPDLPGDENLVLPVMRQKGASTEGVVVKPAVPAWQRLRGDDEKEKAD